MSGQAHLEKLQQQRNKVNDLRITKEVKAQKRDEILSGLKKNHGVETKKEAIALVEKLVSEIEELEVERDTIIDEVDKELDDYESRTNPQERQVQQA